jgi:hypothetical protein
VIVVMVLVSFGSRLLLRVGGWLLVNMLGKRYPRERQGKDQADAHPSVSNQLNHGFVAPSEGADVDPPDPYT